MWKAVKGADSGCAVLASIAFCSSPRHDTHTYGQCTLAGAPTPHHRAKACEHTRSGSRRHVCTRTHERVRAAQRTRPYLPARTRARPSARSFRLVYLAARLPDCIRAVTQLSRTQARGTDETCPCTRVYTCLYPCLYAFLRTSDRVAAHLQRIPMHMSVRMSMCLSAYNSVHMFERVCIHRLKRAPVTITIWAITT